MTKLSKEATIELILEQVKLGMPYKETFKVIQSKTKLVESTFASYWKIANQRHLSTQKSINEQKTREYTDAEIKRLNELILSREKVVEMSSNVLKITYNNFVKSKNSKDADAFNKALFSYSKLEGLDKATKIEQTITDKRQGYIEPIIE